MATNNRMRIWAVRPNDEDTLIMDGTVSRVMAKEIALACAEKISDEAVARAGQVEWFGGMLTEPMEEAAMRLLDPYGSGYQIRINMEDGQ